MSAGMGFASHSYAVEGASSANRTVSNLGDSSQEIGKVNPRNTLVEMTIRCPAVELPGTGPIAIDGTVMVEQLEAPN